jgi:GNAT superfamily N-acetyltransferase
VTSAHVRTATTADEAPVLALIEQLFEPPGGPPPGYSPERGAAGFRWAVKQDNADVLLALDGEEIIGLASVYQDIQSIRFGPRCWLQDLVVHRDRRSRGAGAVLLAAAADWARERGCTHLELSSGMGRVDAHRFYVTQGMLKGYTFQMWLAG